MHANNDDQLKMQQCDNDNEKADLELCLVVQPRGCMLNTGTVCLFQLSFLIHIVDCLSKTAALCAHDREETWRLMVALTLRSSTHTVVASG